MKIHLQGDAHKLAKSRGAEAEGGLSGLKGLVETRVLHRIKSLVGVPPTEVEGAAPLEAFLKKEANEFAALHVLSPRFKAE